MAANRVARFMAAQSIAIVGASEKGLYTAGVLGDLVRYGYKGRLYPVNPRHTNVQGLPCYPSLTALPETPDLVIIVVGRERVLGIVDEAIALGVPAALIITAGFGESDDAGKALEAQLKQRLQGNDLAVIGPNCAGFAGAVGGSLGPIIATRLPAPLTAGNVGFVSASGALMMALHGIFADLHLGVSHLISLGNQVDVSLTEALEFLVEDSHTFAIGAFIEGIDDGPRFRAALLAAQRAGKPLVALKSGRTQVGPVRTASSRPFVARRA
jgi:acyl-CoA synthetase (NDP forming)